MVELTLKLSLATKLRIGFPRSSTFKARYGLALVPALCTTVSPYERSMCVCVGSTTPYNVHVEEVPMVEFRTLLGMCKSRTNFGFIRMTLD